MKLTKKERNLRYRSKRMKGGRQWMYLILGGCSFHDARTVPQSDIHDIPVSVILRALQDRGFLRQWDQKARKLRKITA